MSVFCRYIHVLQIAMFLYGVSAVHRFAIQPENAFAIEGTSVELRCQVNVTLDGGQNYKIQWQFNSTQSAYEVEEDFDRRNGSFTSILTITSVSRQDEGFYHCVLSGKSGITPTSSDTAHITVLSTPTFLQEPKNISAIKGSLTVLRCRLDDVDINAMFVKWTKDNVTVAISNVNDTRIEEDGLNVRYSIIGDYDKVYHLRIIRLEQSDVGIFSCSVHLKYSGQLILESHRARLDVLDLLPTDEKYPLCKGNLTKNYKVGDKLTTECISRGGNGALRLSWLRNGKEIDGTRINVNDPDIRDTWTLTPADNVGNVTCVMKGKAVPKRRQCVIGPLDVYVRPMVSVQPQTTQVSLGQSVTFKCSSNASPPITTYSWLLNGRQLLFSNSELTISWNEIREHVTSDISEINVTCSMFDKHSRVSDVAVVSIEESTVPIHTTESPLIKSGLSSAVISLVAMMSIFFFAVVILAGLIIRYHKIKTRNMYGQSRFHCPPSLHGAETANRN